MCAGTLSKWICKCSCVRGHLQNGFANVQVCGDIWIKNDLIWIKNRPICKTDLQINLRPPRNAKTRTDPSTQQQCFGRGFPKSRCTCLGRAAAWSCRLLLRGWEAKPITCSIKAPQSSKNGELGELWALGSQKTFKIFARRTWVGPDPHLSAI